MKSKAKMSKVKFYYNTKSLKYEKVHIKLWDRLKRVLSVLASGLVFATIIVYIAYTYFDSPKEKQLKREIEQLNYQYEVMTGKLIQMDKVLADLQDRDDNIYRVVFEAEPIASNIRKAGFGGVDRYKELEGYDNSKLIIETTKKLDQI